MTERSDGEILEEIRRTAAGYDGNQILLTEPQFDWLLGKAAEAIETDAANDVQAVREALADPGNATPLAWEDVKARTLPTR